MLRHYLYIIPLALLAACSSNDSLTGPDPLSLNHENGAIQLSAGIVDDGGKLMTRAGAEDNHTNHLSLSSGTELRLRVSGTWTGHAPSTIIQYPNATVGGIKDDTDSKHNIISPHDPSLYWDDYGTADPDNAATGRTEGLTIFGVAINGVTTAPTVAEVNWTALSWTLPADQNANDWSQKDLLISNNVQAGTGDGTYKFSEATTGKLLEFKHALSKITVNLKAGEGFVGTFGSSDPVVTLQNKANWPYTTGTVNVTNGAISSQGTIAAITMKPAATLDVSAPAGYTLTEEALVIPGSAFTADDVEIMKIDAGGNIYYVTAEKIRSAIADLPGFNVDAADAYATKPGKNYVFNIVVNKTDIVVTATVTNWVTVTAAEEAPVINVAGDFGAIDGATTNAFSFYRSTSLNNGYSSGAAVGSYYPAETTVNYNSSTTKWEMATQLYWPTHNTHYQFRGVWPATGTGTGEVSYPRVEDVDDVQVIKVKNVAYAAGTFPSDLMIARPEVAKDATCSNSDHDPVNLYTDGICATEGTINLNFRYMMSQVEVNLSTSDGSDAVTLSGAVVEIVNVHNTGDVKLGDRTVVPTGGTGSYMLNTVAGAGNENKRLSAIIPQQLTYTAVQASGNVMFKITITNADSSTDIYYADIAPIKTSLSEYVAAAIDTNSDGDPDQWFWESGHHYVYNLMIKKTAVKVTATLTDWRTVTSTSEVWF